jgi:hypothetical protein
MTGARHPWPLIAWAAVSVVLVIAGTAGPWGKAEPRVGFGIFDTGGVGTSANGFDAEGWLVVALVVLAALSLAAYALLARPWQAWPHAVGLAAAVAAGATLIFEAADLRDRLGLAALATDVTPQWGIFVAGAGALSLIAAEVALLVRSRSLNATSAPAPGAVLGLGGGAVPAGSPPGAAGQGAPPAGSPSEPGWYQDPYGLGGSRWWDGSGWTDQVRSR